MKLTRNAPKPPPPPPATFDLTELTRDELGAITVGLWETASMYTADQAAFPYKATYDALARLKQDLGI